MMFWKYIAGSRCSMAPTPTSFSLVRAEPSPVSGAA